MRRFSTIAQAFIHGLCQCDRHRAAHWALAVIHTIIGTILAASAAMPEATCVWLAALVYALLAWHGGNRA